MFNALNSSISFAGGQLAFSVSGQSGPVYAIEISTNLTQWSSVFTTNSPAMPFVWTDTATNGPQRFYRVKPGPPPPRAGDIVSFDDITAVPACVSI
jgi:hypothetical protein